uniref:KINASE 2B family protein n=1 Tax=Rhizophora mucronata TaxID=61149 RepID=A0A2P2KVM6_RHIMU
MDTNLGGQYPQKGAYMAANLALQCLNTEARLRPRMSEVLATLELIESPKGALKHLQSDHRAVHTSVRKSPMRPHHSPLNSTPNASPLPSQC